MTQEIEQAITRQFGNHRIVFWYDSKRELRQEFETLSIPGVVKIELDNNEYAVKHRILRQEPKQQFLLYHEGPQPPDLDNWLLDVQLAQATFSADQVSLWATELGLRQEFFALVQEHDEFFKAASRREKLKALLTPEDSHNVIRIKMLAVCANSDTEARVESVLEVLLAEFAEGKDEKFRLIQRCNLDAFLWKRGTLHFGYQSETPGVQDFAIDLFKSGYSLSLEEDAALNQDALVFLKRWKDNRRYKDAFETLSEQTTKIINLETDLQKRDTRDLIEIDLFHLIDQKILSDLVQQVVDRTISAGDCANLIWRRRTTHWFARFEHIYEAIHYGSQFLAQLATVDLNMGSLSDGINKYQETWFQLDQHYRKFIYHLRASGQATLLNKLVQMVENQYSNSFLLKLNDKWQQLIDQTQTWEAAPCVNQNKFYEHWVTTELRTSKIAVIISDSLRYEVAQELSEIIQAEEGYSASLEPMLSMLPSYTQLGMAALLPHQELKIINGGVVEVDGQKATGRDNRAKILDAAIEGEATAIRATELLSMSRDDYRQATKGSRVVYVYHNQIDQVGDKRDSEGRVFEAVETTLQEIKSILKKLYDSYFATVLITSDHGFLYQNQVLDESEFASKAPSGEDVLIRNRRFLVGRDITPNASVKQFDAVELGLSGDYQVFIPKSINRMRVQGAGSRYVHGGASLQEVVLPVIRVNKKREKDVTQVDVDVISSASSVITTGQLAVAFYQTEPVSAKLHPRKLRAGIYSREGQLISDQHELNFDLTSENQREREVRERFVLSSKADDANNQTVYLKLEEQIPGTSHYQEYKSIAYQLRRSFTSDFDF
jgi:uncharacterized protein (TIGR02687 family)